MTDRDNEIISMIEWHIGHGILLSNENLKEVFDLIERLLRRIDRFKEANQSINDRVISGEIGYARDIRKELAERIKEEFPNAISPFHDYSIEMYLDNLLKEME